MEDHLYCKNLHEPIINEKKPEGRDDNERMLLNQKAVAMIRKFIHRSLFEHISNTQMRTSYGQSSSQLFKRKHHAIRHISLDDLVKLEYRDSQNMIEDLNNFKGLVNKLTKAKMAIANELQSLLLLSSFLESWDTFVVTLSNSSPNEKLSMDIVCDSLLNEEARTKERSPSGDSEANVFDTRERSENRGRNKTRAQSIGRSNSR
ncbi:hypothetical protein Salat_0198500 [Sesamum alatum]|uniref:Uncharacterized protein n=1 Tax=Sesamum alatum TaxID=300844 RepID=A0AAE1YXV4_9LAMI|nr:hypothetical protein Salat_0198500 [Sesamum alatum]